MTNRETKTANLDSVDLILRYLEIHQNFNLIWESKKSWYFWSDFKKFWNTQHWNLFMSLFMFLLCSYDLNHLIRYAFLVLGRTSLCLQNSKIFCGMDSAGVGNISQLQEICGQPIDAEPPISLSLSLSMSLSGHAFLHCATEHTSWVETTEKKTNVKCINYFIVHFLASLPFCIERKPIQQVSMPGEE